MIKKALILITILSGTGCIVFVLLLNNSTLSYGHHFSFKNQLQLKIDSLKIMVGNKETTVKPFPDGELSANIEVPERDYPHKVEFWIYSGVDEIRLQADSFDCFNCDGSHLYVLQAKKAEYKFLN